MALHSIEPFGEEAANVRAGIIASTVANSVRNPKKKQHPWTVQDFMIKPALESVNPATNVSDTLKQMFAHVPKKPRA